MTTATHVTRPPVARRRERPRPRLVAPIAPGPDVDAVNPIVEDDHGQLHLDVPATAPRRPRQRRPRQPPVHPEQLMLDVTLTTGRKPRTDDAQRRLADIALALLDMERGERVAAASRERHAAKLAALPHARGCQCDRPFPGDEGDCGKCGRAAPRCQCLRPIDDGTGLCFRCGQVIDP